MLPGAPGGKEPVVGRFSLDSQVLFTLDQWIRESDFTGTVRVHNIRFGRSSGPLLGANGVVSKTTMALTCAAKRWWAVPILVTGRIPRASFAVRHCPSRSPGLEAVKGRDWLGAGAKRGRWGQRSGSLGGSDRRNEGGRVPDMVGDGREVKDVALGHLVVGHATVVLDHDGGPVLPGSNLDGPGILDGLDGLPGGGRLGRAVNTFTTLLNPGRDGSGRVVMLGDDGRLGHVSTWEGTGGRLGCGGEVLADVGRQHR